MKFKHSDIEIPREDPFRNCKAEFNLQMQQNSD